jgi:group I intron endonuclease
MKTNIDRRYTVYVHITPSEKKYVGITCQDVEARWRGGKGYKKNQPFFNAIHKYGWNNIRPLITLQNVLYEKAAKKEQELISLYQTTDKSHGYNVCRGGENGWVGVHHTDVAKQKMSNAKKGKQSPRKGCKLSEDTKKKLSDSHKGKYHGLPIVSKTREKSQNNNSGFSDIHKQKISRALKGIQRSDAVRENMSKAQTKTKKPVICIVTGEIFESQTAAMKRFNINKTLIGRVCKGKNKTAKGLVFRYV